MYQVVPSYLIIDRTLKAFKLYMMADFLTVPVFEKKKNTVVWTGSSPCSVQKCFDFLQSSFPGGDRGSSFPLGLHLAKSLAPELH